MVEDAHKQFTGLACFWMAAAIIAGIALALLLSDWIFSKSPSDLRRTGVLLDALEESTLQPKFVVMGNSIVMSGIDTRRLGEQLPGQPVGLNLATTGQNPVDAYLYYQLLPESVELIVQFTLPRFAINRDSIEPQKFNAMFMYGYRPDAITRQRLSRIFGDAARDILERSSIRQRFESRWIVQQAADNFVRGLIRQDLDFEAYTFDLYFPKSGAVRLPDEQMQRALDIRYDSPIYEFRPEAGKPEFYLEAARRAAESGRDFILVISPLHPIVHERNGEEWYRQARAFFAGLGVTGKFAVIDSTDVVPERNYVDPVHLDEEGAQILSDFVAGKIRALGLEPGS